MWEWQHSFLYSNFFHSLEIGGIKFQKNSISFHNTFGGGNSIKISYAPSPHVEDEEKEANINKRLKETLIEKFIEKDVQISDVTAGAQIETNDPRVCAIFLECLAKVLVLDNGQLSALKKRAGDNVLNCE